MFASQSQRTVEILQMLIHKRQIVQTEDQANTEGLSGEFLVLTCFLQRTITKPLVISAGGFMQFTRSFVITVGGTFIKNQLE